MIHRSAYALVAHGTGGKHESLESDARGCWYEGLRLRNGVTSIVGKAFSRWASLLRFLTGSVAVRQAQGRARTLRLLSAVRYRASEEIVFQECPAQFAVRSLAVPLPACCDRRPDDETNDPPNPGGRLPTAHPSPARREK